MSLPDRAAAPARRARWCGPPWCAGGGRPGRRGELRNWSGRACDDEHRGHARSIVMHCMEQTDDRWDIQVLQDHRPRLPPPPLVPTKPGLVREHRQRPQPHGASSGDGPGTRRRSPHALRWSSSPLGFDMIPLVLISITSRSFSAIVRRYPADPFRDEALVGRTIPRRRPEAPRSPENSRPRFRAVQRDRGDRRARGARFPSGSLAWPSERAEAVVERTMTAPSWGTADPGGCTVGVGGRCLATPPHGHRGDAGAGGVEQQWRRWNCRRSSPRSPSTTASAWCSKPLAGESGGWGWAT